MSTDYKLRYRIADSEGQVISASATGSETSLRNLTAYIAGLRRGLILAGVDDIEYTVETTPVEGLNDIEQLEDNQITDHYLTQLLNTGVTLY